MQKFDFTKILKLMTFRLCFWPLNVHQIWSLSGDHYITFDQNSTIKKESLNSLTSTLGAEMFGVGDFWLETRVILKISSHSWYPRTFDFFSWGWSTFFEKRLKMADSKNWVFQNRQFSKFLLINPTNSRTILWNFGKKFWELAIL